MFAHVLLPVSSLDMNRKRLKKVADLAKSGQSKVTLVYVSDPLPPGFYSASPLSESFLSPKEHQRACENFAQHLFEKITEVLGKDIVEGQVHVMNADITAGILQAAKNAHADVIAMLSHKYSGLKRLILGSHTQEVMSHSTLPVLVL
jgi:nucleotide-binding universal stress UspA family protein